MTGCSKRIAIIGAGFTGSLLAIHLLRSATGPVAVTLIERRERFGPGLAYSTDNPSHLLNVRASNMSAFSDRPYDFLAWLGSSGSAGATAAPGLTFVERATFGRYVATRLDQYLAAAESHRIELIRDTVTSLSLQDEGVVLGLEERGSRTVDEVVLATGHFPPEAPHLQSGHLPSLRCYRGDPWHADALSNLDPGAAVLLIGSGLTMVDLALPLIERGHFGPIHVLSRRGLLPRAHAAAAAGPVFLPTPLPRSITDLTHRVRDEVRRNGDWRSVIDSLRPVTVALWRGLSATERARFLRHLRPWWEVHRHRMAPAIADRIAGAVKAGALTVHAGRLVAVAGDDGATVTIRRRHGGSQELVVDRIINCSGLSCDFQRIQDPLLRQLLDDGVVRPDQLGIGLDVGEDCAVIGRDGNPSDRIYAAGPLTRGAFWEMTAVPDLRVQTEALARRLLREPVPARQTWRIRPRPAGPGPAGTAIARSRASNRPIITQYTRKS